MFRPHHLLVSLFAVLSAAAFSAGCSEDEKATPRVVFDSTIAPGGHTKTECPEIGGTWFKIGEFGNPALGRVDENNPESELKAPPKPVDTGATDPESGGTVDLVCNVVPSGDAFDVSATIALSGSQGGFFQVIGRFRQSGDQNDIDIVMSKGGKRFRQKNCIARYTTPQRDGNVAAGRVFAEVECPDIENSESATPIKCRGTANFKLENCSQ